MRPPAFRSWVRLPLKREPFHKRPYLLSCPSGCFTESWVSTGAAELPAQGQGALTWVEPMAYRARDR